MLVDSIYSQFVRRMIRTKSYYFPATRSDILRGCKDLSASIIRNSTFDDIGPFWKPKLTGAETSFVSDMIAISHKPGTYYDLAESLESEILHGHIRLLTRENSVIPEVVYISQNNNLPLHRTSSTISELAPLSLYLKYIVKWGGLLIIEEPETRLHPETQLILAKYIVRMIRKGLNVLITTHSAFLLEQLGQFILASKIESGRGKKLEFADDDDYLLPEEVSPYVFVKNSEDEYEIRPIEIDDEDGISQEEFVKVSEVLYSRYTKLHELLPDV